MTQIVYDQDLSSLSRADGLIIDIMTPKIGTITPADVDSVYFVGTATWGQMDTLLPILDPRDQLSKIGPQTVNPHDLATFTGLALNLGVDLISVTRVGSDTQTAAILPISGATHPITILTGLYPGSYINGVTAVLTYSPNTPASQQNTTGNTQKVYVDLTINVPNANAEVFRNLDANLFSGTYSIDGGLLNTAIIAAVNNGQANGRGPSLFFVASAGTASPGSPIMNTANVVTTPGTDGTDFSNTAAFNSAALGSTSTFPYTGMNAGAGGISGSAMAIIGGTDVANIAATVLAFAKAQNSHYCATLPQGTSTTGALALKTTTAGLFDFSCTVLDGNWPSFLDTYNGAITRYVDSGAMAAIRLALTNVPNSPANLPMPLITGTTRVNAFSQPQPYSDGESLQLENAGINFWSNDTAGDVGFALAHNKNSLGKTGQPLFTGNIAYGRVTQWLAKSFGTPLLGKMVGLTQGFNSTSDTQRKNASAMANSFLQQAITNGIIDAGSIAVCDLTNNSPGRGLLRIDLRIYQREVIDNVAIGILSNLAVAVAINPQQVSPTT